MVQYNIQLHRNAYKILEQLTEPNQERIKETLRDVANYVENPADHPKCEILNNDHDETLYKIKVGKLRALAVVERDNLNVLKVGQRQGFYDDLDDIYNRL